MDQFRIPEFAIETFERIHGLQVTVHDHAGDLGTFLAPHRFYHRSALCLAVKAQGHLGSCTRFELQDLRSDLAKEPEGRMHVCHAGLTEWVVPAFDQGQLRWILFAGQRLPSSELFSAIRMPLTHWQRSPWSRDTPSLPIVKEEEGQLILEHLRQLGARLQQWVKSLRLVPASEDASRRDYLENGVVLRETLIRLFIEENYASPSSLAMLAKRLHLSESRASHVVRITCGSSFRDLLIQKRLMVATELLRCSSMSVLDVALAAGFEDLAHFHRIFRRRIGTTPGKYRVHGGT